MKVNHEKTEALAFGDSSIWEDLPNKYNLRNVIKILGIYFSGNVKERDDLNYRETLKVYKEISKFMEVERLVTFGEDTDS